MSDSMRIHKGCGVIVPRTEKECARCRESYRTSWVDIPRNEEQLYWVRLEGRIRCLACENPVPVNELATGDRIECPSCGREVDFPKSFWKRWLEMGRSAADLCGPESDAIDPDVWASFKKSKPEEHEVFAAIGKTGATLSYSEATFGGPSEERNVSPGHPCCERCQQPFELALEAGIATLSCAGCGSARRYVLPESPHRIAGLEAVVAPAHLEGAGTVKEDDGEGNELGVLRCPNCSGALTIEGDSSYFPCPFCRATCYLPARLRGGSAAAVLTEPWWALFRGPSPLQLSLVEKGRASAARRAEKEKKRLARETRQKAESKERKAQARAEEKAAKSHKRTLTLVAIATLVVGGALFLLLN